MWHNRGRRAFTVLELIIVLTVLGMLAGLATSTHKNTARKSRETVLRHNLAQIRLTLDQYNVDKGRYPDSLQSLVDEGYLRDFPVDPITRSADTWEEVLESEYSDEDSSYEPGVFDVRSGSDERALDGTFYYEW
ncbi:type II secretion system protein [Acanthopleuribacter pedis]|uniref:Prepilin-type N-terminal cleavage/methylation domain-containing protein n=1 Tax=Acanthopleuribacter pedis TaxID=442870 RepID=A0A8J7U397_9BACT|nr:prepilin-type N-terminal cleavage/methylation domain-containing protein [Acanthopleuribacter pedis]MBO1318118.1 prepilin-type N-terminal cleavage/methylation domain-containing protein [Acanthopleuribacter pedis]